MVGIAVALYIVLVVAASFYFRISLTPDRIVLLLALAALATGRVRLFLKDWSIFLVVLVAWQVLSGLSRHIGNFRPHVTEMIVADKALFFGQVPTIWLQHHFYHPGHIQWYDIGASILYLLHFVFPLAVAFALWLGNRTIFLEFVVAFLLLSLAGFATFVLFPAAPPWIAANWWHYLPHVYKILNAGTSALGGQQSFSGLYVWLWQHQAWDLFGAVPSEHAAFPLLCFFYVRKAWGRVAWLVLAYSLLVWIAVVYLGEHYAADVIAGAAYAVLTFAGMQLILARRSRVLEQAEDEEISPDTVRDGVPA